MSIWHSISFTGVFHTHTLHEKRNIVLTNRVSVIISGFTFLLFNLTWFSFGLIYSARLAILFTILFLLPIQLNRIGWLNTSRMLLAVILSLASLVISVIDKFDYFVLEQFQYFEFRLTQLIASLFPIILFRLKERKFWLTAMSLNFATILLFDPIHNLFGVGYFQMGFTDANYYFLNYMVVATFLVIAFSTYFLKRSFEKSEHENESLIETLNKANRSLKEKRDEMEKQQQELVQANTIIKQQQELLTQENIHLAKELVEKNNQLLETNEELIAHNNDLQQFSYSISHNLKGPVASISGLLSLVDPTQLGEVNQPLINHLQLSLKSLETTIKDLSNIIDIRNKVSKLKQKLNLSEEINHIRTLLKKDIEENNIGLIIEVREAPELYSVKPMLHSILYNLISNAIKYRNPNIPSIIRLRAHTQPDWIIIEVEDNGLGIDLGKYGDKLFGLYKRFHNHTEGKGLGLFLVKLQAEALGGRIEVASKLNQGTIFSLHLKKQKNVEEQVLVDNDFVKVYFNASLDALVNVWKRDHSPQEFAQALELGVDFLKTYRTPNWISDIRNVPTRDEEALKEIRKKQTSELIKAGLRRIAAVLPAVDPVYFSSRVKELENVYPFRSGFFTSFEEATEWIHAESQKDSQIKQTADLPFQ